MVQFEKKERGEKEGEGGEKGEGRCESTPTAAFARLKTEPQNAAPFGLSAASSLPSTWLLMENSGSFSLRDI